VGEWTHKCGAQCPTGPNRVDRPIGVKSLSLCESVYRVAKIRMLNNCVTRKDQERKKTDFSSMA
jgi:hypothetical protein